MATSTTASAVTATTGHASVVTVTVSPSQTDSSEDLVSSTMSLIYIYSAATTESEPTATASSSSSSENLPGGAIAGIVVGCIAFLILLAMGLFCYSRKVARERRSERAASHMHLSLPYSTSPHELLSPTMPSPTMQQVSGVRGDRHGDRRISSRNTASRNSRAHSNLHQQRQYSTPSPAIASPRTPGRSRQTPRTPTHGLPTHHELEGSRAHQWPKVHEMYGSYAQPLELQAGSTTNLVSVAEVAQIKKAASKGRLVTTTTNSSSKTSLQPIKTEGLWDKEKDRDIFSDSASTGYLSPTWPMPPSFKEKGAGTSNSSSHGTTLSEIDLRSERASTMGGSMSAHDMQSIHVYFSPGSEYAGSPTVNDFATAAALSRRQSQMQIMLAMSQAAASSSPKSPMSYKSTGIRGGSTAAGAAAVAHGAIHPPPPR